ncbi:MAG: tyrosine-type recombinase/integrase [Puniceicoccaceae bacterium]
MFDQLGERKYLSRNERTAFLDAVLKSPLPAEKAFCLTLFFTGCRISEALRLSVSSVDFEERYLVFRTLKQRRHPKHRAIFIPPALLEMLKRQTQGKKAHERVFPFSRSTGWRIVKKYMTIANLSGSKACPKALRHTYAISYLLEKTPITTVKKWLGHENLKNTAIYLDIVNEEEYNEAQKIWPDMRD